jgi:hypothetical protein
LLVTIWSEAEPNQLLKVLFEWLIVRPSHLIS